MNQLRNQFRRTDERGQSVLVFICTSESRWAYIWEVMGGMFCIMFVFCITIILFGLHLKFPHECGHDDAFCQK